MSKSIVLFWATMIMVSSTCFGADIHYCKGEAKTFGLFKKAEKCSMHEKKVEAKVHKCCAARKIKEQKPERGFPVLENGKCCYNHQIAFKTDVEQSSNATISYNHVPLQADDYIGVTLTYKWDGITLAVPSFRGPPDPYILEDYQSFLQVFRI